MLSAVELLESLATLVVGIIKTQGNGNHGILAHGRYEGSVIFFSLFSAI